MRDILKINNVTYPIKFGYGAFRSLGKKWNCTGTTAVFKKLAALDSVDDNGLSFDQEKIILDLVLAGIDCGSDYKIELPIYDHIALDVLLNPDAIKYIFSVLMDCMPKTGKIEPTKKKKK
jgi:hypothetical protein